MNTTTCSANDDSRRIKPTQPVRPGSDTMNSNIDDSNARSPTRKSALKVAKEGHKDEARSAISASFDDSENEIIEVRARGYHRKLAKKKSASKQATDREKAQPIPLDAVSSGVRHQHLSEAADEVEERVAMAEEDDASRAAANMEKEIDDLPPDELPDGDIPGIFADDAEIDEEVERLYEPEDEGKWWDVEDGGDPICGECVDEAPKRRVLRDPGEPTQEEWEEHRIDHIPYRSWCPFCVKGRGRGTQHRNIKEKPTVPTFGFDYLHGSEAITEDTEESKSLKILVGKCHMTKCIFAHTIPQKGIDINLYAVERLKRDVLWLGHNKIILKTDNENAILALLRNAIKALRIDDALENIQEAHPAAYDPSSNGSTENACLQVAGQIRTLRACTEDRIGRKIPVDHSVFSWLVEHAAWLLTIRQQQSDGITPYTRLRGSTFRTLMLGFGECCLYQPVSPAKDTGLDGKLAPKYRDAVFLGYSRDSNEYLLWDIAAKKMIRARGVQRVSESQRWKADALAAVNIKPQGYLHR